MRRPDLAPLAVAGAAAGCAALGERIPEIDAWWQLAYGRYELAHHALPPADTWSWTAPGHPLVVTEWLFDAAMAAAARLGPWGAFGLLLACLLALGAAAFALYAALARSRPVGALLTIVLLALLLPFLALLPQLPSFALFAAVFLVLEAARLRGPSRLLFLPPLFALWANVHGTYPLGWMIVGLETLLAWAPALPGRLQARHRRGTRRWLPVALLGCLLAPLANPYGWRLLPYELRLASSPFHLQNIAEFQSPNFHNPYMAWFILPALLLGVGGAMLSRQRLPARDLLAAAGLLAGALVMVRLLPYALTALGAVAAAVLRGRRVRPQPARWPLLVAAVAAVGLTLWRQAPEAWPPTAGEPVAAAAYVRAHLDGRGFNTYEWGSYLESVWNGRPAVYIDSRGDMYGDTTVLQRYMAIMQLQVDPGPALTGQGVDWALLPASQALVLVLRAEGWGTVFAGGGAVVLLRPAPAGAA